MTTSKHMFKELQWLFPQRVNNHRCLLAYKSLNGLAPEYLSQLFTKTSELHSRNSRSVDNDEMRVPFARTNYFSKSFSVEGANQWNALPIKIRQISNINTFKTNQRMHLLNS